MEGSAMPPPAAGDAKPAGRGGGSMINKQIYEYRANSNLVLTTDQRPRLNDEPSGEVESLTNHLN